MPAQYIQVLQNGKELPLLLPRPGSLMPSKQDSTSDILLHQILDGKRDEHTASSLSTLQISASILSIPLPHDTIPQRSSQSNTEDARALHHIFSSSSSVRGYQTAATTPAYLPTARPSFDHDFRFGNGSPSLPLQTPLEKLGNYIHQRLSDSRLSKSSSKHDRVSDLAGRPIKQPSPPKEEIDFPLGNSQSTTGFTDILASKTASQGGYDSDAHTIASPLLPSQAGTIKVSAGYVKQTLDRFGFGDDSPVAVPLAPPIPYDGQLSPSLRDSPIHAKGQSSPFPTTPTKVSFAAALQLGTNESPTDVLRRLSIGIANGTIKTPDTPELREFGMPSISEVKSHWRLTAPARTSSLKTLDHELHTKLKRLSDRVESAKRDSMISASLENKRSSLISELDPALLEYMSKYAERLSSEQYDEDQTNGDVEVTDGKTRALTSTQPFFDSQARGEDSSKLDNQSPAKTDSDSLHLFNMRISQRLMSQSQNPIQSPDTSNNASARSLVVTTSQPSVSNFNRYPTWIATEHNRRPSDPQTKRLFERETQGDRGTSHNWKTVTSVNSGSTSSHPKTKFNRVGNDASSFYWSDADVTDSQLNSPLDGSRRSSFQNPHSLAVGGRSVSAGISGAPVSKEINLVRTAGKPSLYRGKPQWMSNESENDNNISNKVQRGRSVSMPHKRDQVQHQSPTPVPRRLRNDTDAAETISEVSMARVYDRRNEGMTEISAQDVRDKRDEKMSEIEDRYLAVPTSNQRVSETDKGKADQITFVGPRSRSRRGTISGDTPSLGIKECGASVWERAFKNVKENSFDDPAGGFLTAPRFDRNGRHRQSTQSGASDDGSALNARARSTSASRPGHDVAAVRRSSVSPSLDDHVRLCSIAKGALPRAGPAINFIGLDGDRRHSQTTREKVKTRKKSVLELSKRFASVVGRSDQVRKSESLNSIKDLPGHWARFPSHTREERNGSATDRDRVKVQDFLPVTPLKEAWEYPVPTNTSISSINPFASSAMRRLQTKTSRRLDKARSMTLREQTTSVMLSPAERSRRSRKGFAGKLKRWYRDGSSDMRKYTYTQGHRSSFSVGDTPEFPELEVLPGEGLFRRTDFQRSQMTDSSAETNSKSIQNVRSNETTRADDSSDNAQTRRPDAADLARSYAECVGDLSALKSEDAEVQSLTFSNPTSLRPGLVKQDMMSTELRDSSSEYRRQLEREQEKVKLELLEKIGRLDGNQDDDGEDVRQRGHNRVEQIGDAGTSDGKEPKVEGIGG